MGGNNGVGAQRRLRPGGEGVREAAAEAGHALDDGVEHLQQRIARGALYVHSIAADCEVEDSAYSLAHMTSTGRASVVPKSPSPDGNALLLVYN
jgi:hypothetical protein